MNSAIDKFTRQLVFADSPGVRHDHYFCAYESCGRLARFISGENKVPYFAHYRFNPKCPLSSRFEGVGWTEVDEKKFMLDGLDYEERWVETIGVLASRDELHRIEGEPNAQSAIVDYLKSVVNTPDVFVANYRKMFSLIERTKLFEILRFLIYKTADKNYCEVIELASRLDARMLDEFEFASLSTYLSRSQKFIRTIFEYGSIATIQKICSAMDSDIRSTLSDFYLLSSVEANRLLKRVEKKRLIDMFMKEETRKNIRWTQEILRKAKE